MTDTRRRTRPRRPATWTRRCGCRPGRAPEPGRAARPGRTRSRSSTAGLISSRGCPSDVRGASRSCSSMASSPDPGSGALPRLLRPAGLGGPRAQPAEPLLVPDRRPGPALVRDLHGRRGRRRGAARARHGAPRARHGRASCPQGRRAPRGGRARLLAPHLPKEIRVAPKPHEVRDIPRPTDRRCSDGTPCRSVSSASIATSRSTTSSGSSTSWGKSRARPERPGARSSRA